MINCVTEKPKNYESFKTRNNIFPQNDLFRHELT